MVGVYQVPELLLNSFVGSTAEENVEGGLKVSGDCLFPQPRDLTSQETQDYDIRQIRSVLDGHGRECSKQAVPLLVLAWAILLKEYSRSETLLLSICDNEKFVAQIPFESQPASSIKSALEQAAEFLTFPTDPVKSEAHATGNDQYASHVTLDIMDCHPKTRGNFRLHSQEALRLVWWQTDATIDVHVYYDLTKCMDEQAQRFLSQYQSIVQQLMRQDRTRCLRDIEMISVQDKDTLMQWNSGQIMVSEGRLHESFQARTRERPNEPAAVTTEGCLTYAQLDELSSILAATLVERGIGGGAIVPILFQKSLWAIVSILAVLKTGAASTSICASHPNLYITKVVEQTGSTVVLTSETEYDRLARVKGVDRMVVSEATLRSLPRPSASWQLPSGDKEDVACVLFTSGSTGQPKGVLLSHRAIATTMHHHGLATGIDKPPRSLQFSSYAFDMAIYEIFHALVRGGTVYTPSEEERLHDLPSFVAKHRTTWAFITPTMLRTFGPEQFPTMETIVVGGEAVGNDLVQTWGSRLYNGFGPAEVSICVSTRMDPRCWVEGTIGRPVGCIGWIVNPNDMNTLTPIGGIGELLVEGPIVAHGYFNQPEKTEEVFVSAPSWRSTFSIPHRGAFFRTSDLVQFNWDGSMRYLGRRDNVRKINGQRVDIENIEFTLRQMETSLDISVDVLTSPGPYQQDIVVAFVAERSTKADVLKVSSMCKDSAHVEMKRYGREDAIRDEMGHRLPRYMIPAFVIELSALPKTATSKVDRKHLAAMFTGRSESEMMKLLKSKTNGKAKRIATSAAEHQVASLVQETLRLEARDIDMNSAFVHMGGDSLAAVRLVSLARKSGISLKAMDLLQHDRKLADLAEELQKCESIPLAVGSTVMPPFSMLPENSDDRAKVLEAAQEQCGIREESIRDIYPCTPIQEGLFSSTSVGSQAYIDRFTLTLSPGVDRLRLVRAWNTLIRSSDILRTRIVQTSIGVYQVVTDHHELPIPSYKSEEQYLTSDATKEMGPGTPLVVVGLIVPETSSGTEKSISTPKAQLVVTIHHAVYDGWSWEMMLQDVEAAYRGESLPPRPFSGFVGFLQGRDLVGEQEFWRSYCHNLNAAVFPEALTTNRAAQLRIRLPYRHQPPQSPPPGREGTDREEAVGPQVTPAIKVHLAWAILISLYTQSPGVVYGTISNGRLSSYPGMDGIMGPTLATIPFGHTIDRSMRIDQALQATQDNMQSTVEWEHAGLHSISRVSPEASTACMFQTLVVIQPRKDPQNSAVFDSVQERTGADGFVPGYSMVLICTPGEMDQSWELELLLDDGIVPPAQGERIVRQFSHILSQLNGPQSTRLEQLDCLDIADQVQLCEWQLPPPSRVDYTIHGLVKLQCQIRPQEQGVCSWDGSFTYDEVQRFSDTGAIGLRDMGIGPGTIVPICLERTKWVVIAMLSVMKTGAAFVLLDQSSAWERNQSICKTVAAQWVITSAICRGYCESFGPQILLFSDQVVREEAIQPSAPQEDLLDTVRHSDLLYVVFTSGSTGNPKGVEIEHGSYCSAMIAQREKLYIRAGTRVLQLSSYAFDSFAVEILTTLSSGGCVCIPSTEELSGGIGSAIRQYRAEWMCATPSMLRLITPAEVPSLRTVVAVGETLLPSQVAVWAPAVTLLCGYGPSECCTGATVHTIHGGSVDPRNIGTGMGCTLWVVDQYDHNRLMPIGAIGELVLQGRIVGRGYLNEPEKTSSVFLDQTEWSTEMNSSGERLYKTGDLVRINPDGTCLFLGRKDHQVKLRGQRLNLMDVEHHLTEALGAQFTTIMADIIKPRTEEIGDTHHMLVAMVETSDEGMFSTSTSQVQTNDELLFVPPSSRFVKMISQVEQELSATLPAVMIPSLWLLARQMPLTVSGKADRRQVRAAATSLTPEALLTFGCSGAQASDVPLASTETTAWIVSEVVADALHSRLKLDRNRVVGKNVTLSRIGLDSIDMMAISVAISSRFDVRLPMAPLFRSGLTVRDVALMVSMPPASQGLEQEPPLTMDLWSEYHRIRERIHGICAHSRKLENSSLGGRSNGSDRRGRVLLTGGTGFLGTHILKALLEDPRVQSVTVLVRAESDKIAIRRVVQTAHGAGWWRESHRNRVRTWRGCLSQPFLGLSESRWKILCGLDYSGDGFDTVIHNGAWVHWGQDYHKLKSVNTESTINLLSALAQLAYPVAFTYVSALLPGSSEMDDDRSVAKLLSTCDGYSQSKFMSELAIKEFQRDSVCKHIHINIIRPGWIIGSTDNGMANVSDYVWRVVGSAVSCGLYNSEEDSNSWIFISPVNLVAGLITSQTLDGHRDTTGLNDSQPLQITSITDGLAAPDFWRAVSTASHQTFGSPLQPCQGINWLHQMKGSMMATGGEHLLWPVFEFLESNNGRLGSSYADPIVTSATLRSLLFRSVVQNVQHICSAGSIEIESGLMLASSNLFGRRPN
ncbi:Male sterility NAD-binding [Penicillium concentricum]|uniref:Male sterility NAD-binding n=1 Tax=Penicillium concentricum TaxID=293559 RepID=A0A9W9VHW8_9EURO|nr:Male sterility NAD-binding [Penicillium concentricum]KAJ5382512.1 Male sterility NAD-binding [Penicillium concentricum]